MRKAPYGAPFFVDKVILLLGATVPVGLVVQGPLSRRCIRFCLFILQ